MDDTSRISPLRRWLESILVWYILFMIVYLVARFIFRTDWRFIALINNIAPYLFLPVVFGLMIALLLRARRLSGLYLLGTLVGALWILPPLIPTQFNNSSAEGTQIEIVSFNLYPDNPTLDEASAWISAYAPDIVALQEMPNDMSAFANFDSFYNERIAQTVERGNIVYTQYPVIDTSDIEIDNGIIQRLVLDIEGMQVALYNVHLIMPLNDREADWLILRYDEARRNAQIEQLIDIISQEPLPIIMVGDFNLTEWSPIYHRLAGVLDDAYRNTSWGIGATFPASASEEISAGYPRLFRLDYVWYSEELSATTAVVGANLGSDHLPLRVELTLR